MTHQKLSASYLRDCEQILDQLAKAIKDKAWGGKDLKAWNGKDLAEFYIWIKTSDIAQELSANISCLADTMEREETKKLSEAIHA